MTVLRAHEGQIALALVSSGSVTFLIFSFIGFVRDELRTRPRRLLRIDRKRRAVLEFRSRPSVEELTRTGSLKKR